MRDEANYPDMEWGCTEFLVPGLPAAWGARAIYHATERTINLLPDRQSIHGQKGSEEYRDLVGWLNGSGLAKLGSNLTRYGRNDIVGGSPQILVDDGLGVIVGVSLYGDYLYLAGWLLQHVPEYAPGKRTAGLDRLVEFWGRQEGGK